MILNLNKPIGWTSFDVCKKIKGITKERKVGHAGTLDPFAKGVLIIGTGSDTKSLSSISNQTKSYVASITLGAETDTLDIDGKIVLKKNVPKLKENRFIGFLPHLLEITTKFRQCIQQRRLKEESSMNMLVKIL